MKIGLIVSFGMLLTSAAANAATVAVSGNWSNSTTWGETVPTTSLSAPMDILNFGASSLALTIDATQYVREIQLGTYTNSVVNINAGQSLYLSGGTSGSPVPFISATSSTNSITFNGEGILRLNFNGDKYITRGAVTFNTSVDLTGGLGLYDSGGGSLAINKTFTASGQLSVGSNWAVSIASGVATTWGGDFNIWGGNTTFNMGTGASVTTSMALLVASANIDGSLTINGSNYLNLTVSLGRSASNNIVLGANSSITQTAYSATREALVYGKVTSNAAAGALSFRSNLFMRDGSALVLNTTGAFKTGGAASQEASDFYIATFVSGGTHTAATVGLTLNADNDFGGFAFANNSVLNVANNGYDMVIGELRSIDGTGTFKLKFKELEDMTVKLISLDNVDTFEEDGFLRAYNILWLDSESAEDYVYLLADTQNGGWWINATSVPEPATWAAIFGALALGFAIYRKRK